MIRRFVAAALCVGVLGGAAATAEAANWRSGLYTGITQQNADVSLKVTSSKRAVINYTFEGAVLDCNNGATVQIDGPFRTSASQKIRINRLGKFGFVSAGPTHEINVSGKVKRNRAAGFLSMTALFDEEGNPNPAGPVKCDTGRLKWVAYR